MNFGWIDKDSVYNNLVSPGQLQHYMRLFEIFLLNHETRKAAAAETDEDEKTRTRMLQQHQLPPPRHRVGATVLASPKSALSPKVNTLAMSISTLSQSQSPFRHPDIQSQSQHSDFRHPDFQSQSQSPKQQHFTVNVNRVGAEFDTIQAAIDAHVQHISIGSGTYDGFHIPDKRQIVLQGTWIKICGSITMGENSMMLVSDMYIENRVDIGNGSSLILNNCQVYNTIKSKGIQSSLFLENTYLSSDFLHNSVQSLEPKKYILDFTDGGNLEAINSQFDLEDNPAVDALSPWKVSENGARKTEDKNGANRSGDGKCVITNCTFKSCKDGTGSVNAIGCLSDDYVFTSCLFVHVPLRIELAYGCSATLSGCTLSDTVIKGDETNVHIDHCVFPHAETKLTVDGNARLLLNNTSCYCTINVMHSYALISNCIMQYLEANESKLVFQNCSFFNESINVEIYRSYCIVKNSSFLSNGGSNIHQIFSVTTVDQSSFRTTGGEVNILLGSDSDIYRTANSSYAAQFICIDNNLGKLFAGNNVMIEGASAFAVDPIHKFTEF